MLLLGSGGPQKDARRKNKHNCSARPENSSYKDLTCYPTKDIHLTFLLYKSKPWCLSIFLRYKTVHILFPACTRVYAFTARCTYVQRMGLRGLGVVPTVDIAHYEYHYLSSCACAENRAIAPLIFSGYSTWLQLQYILDN